ncbi:putative ABC transporter, substrate-binding protein [Desulfonema limicola]|uniref:ABC transporter, substrate-binding protein n=1 Tax=Desulfonema limicola TaxID=45656 RepID=A0A975B3J7_9BACT|nr:branched-chain amino acid ABC transporter substrate-binding protein [Desulfonema limicola]QTA78142.1 putative ABC transporter, substrate-binding protein [Desulfonema limicola]
MKKYIFLLLLISVISIITILALKKNSLYKCKDSIGCVTIGPGQPVTFAVIQALTGKVAFLGYEQIRGIELAVLHRKGQILSHPIKLQKENSFCTYEGGTVAALKAAADPNIAAVFGTTCSGAAIIAAKIISEAGMVMISGNNSAPSLTSSSGNQGSDWYPGYFRTSFNDDLSGKAAAIFAFNHLNIKKAALINDGDVYTKGLTQGFGYTFEQLGGNIVLDTSINKGDENMIPVLEAAAASGAELLFFPLFQPEGDYMVHQSKNVSGFENITLMGNGALLTSTFINSVKSKGTGMYFVGPGLSSEPDYKYLEAEYKKIYQENPPTNYYTYAYDAANLLFNAVSAVAETEKDGTLHIPRAKLREAMYATKNMQGVSGILNCDQFGDCGSARFNIMRLDNPELGIEGLKSNIIYTFIP